MKNFNIDDWVKSLEEIDFSYTQETLTIDEEAKFLSEKINFALDKIAPVKTFIIRPNYIHGLSQEAKILMKDRDKTRSALKSKTHSQLERKALMIKYRKTRNQTTAQIKKDKQMANSDRINTYMTMSYYDK